MKRRMHMAWLRAALSVGVVVRLCLPQAAQAAPPPKRAPRAEEAEVALRARDAEGSVLALRVPTGILLAQLQQQGSSANTNLNQIGGASVSSSLYDSGNTALKVNCVVGCSATGGFSDNGTFTVGTTGVTNISGLFNDAAANLTSGNAGAIRATTDRMLYVNIGKIAGSVPGLTGSSLNVNCTGGCSGSAGFTDNTGFTAGATAETNIGGVFNDALAAVSSGNAAAARITSNRAMHVNLRNASGTEIGTSGAPLRMDPTGTTTQPVSGTVTGNQGTAAALSGGWPVKVTDGSSALQIDPCQAHARSSYAVSITANTQIITGVASKQTYVCSALLIVGAATNVALVEGTGTVCATGTAGMSGGTTAATGWNLAANGGYAFGSGQNWIFKTATAADSVCLLVSAANQVSGTITYVQQ